MINIYYSYIEDTLISTNFEFLFNLLDKDQKQKVHKSKRMENKFQLLLSNLLNKYVLMNQYGLSISNINIMKELYGKPYILNKYVNFNISHAAKIVIAAYSQYEEIGIDIEQINSIEFDAFRNVFLDYEFNEILKQENIESQLKQFYKFWTLKECYLKYLGIGLYRDLTSFGFYKTGLGYIKLEDKIYKDNSNKLKFISYEIDDYISSICCAKDEKVSRPIKIGVDEIIKFYKEMDYEN